MTNKHVSLSRPEVTAIRLRKVRQNNLKGFDLDIPLGKLTVVTGLSGTGKSSLVFDTLHAEGQRRYVETFSPYTRQFLELLARPDVESIENIRPSIALHQSNTVKTSRSTVGTMTELCDHFKNWFPQVAELIDPDTGKPIRQDSPQSIWKQVLAAYKGESLWLTFKLHRPAALAWSDLVPHIKAQGYTRAVLNHEPVRIEALDPITLDPAANLFVIQDRIKINAQARSRFIQACTPALEYGKGDVQVFNESGTLLQSFSQGLRSPETGKTFAPARPPLFSFNSPIGACPTCRGFGRVIEIDYRLVIPDPTLSIRAGAIKPFQGDVYSECLRELIQFAPALDIPLDTPWEALTPLQKQRVIEGDPNYGPEGKEWPHAWYGIAGFFKWQESKAYKMHVRVFLSKYRSYVTCPTCHGSRLKPEALYWQWQGYTLPELYQLPVTELLTLFQKHAPAATSHTARSPEVLAREAICSRLHFLDAVGLGYLNLDRASRTLSGGEVERVNLTACLGSSLVETLFILDEPSVGLHSADIDRLISILRRLTDQGNTVVVVEHDEAMMRAADHLIELGPEPGARGGNVVFSGTLDALLVHSNSLTGAYLSQQKNIPTPEQRRPVSPRKTPQLKITAATKHNLDKLNVELPLQRLVALSGVSGSGKSTLLDNVIYQGYLEHSGQSVEDPAQIKRWHSDLPFSEVVQVDQSPLSKTPRSNPALYAGVWNPIRELFAAEPTAQEAGLTASHFSFNSAHGRCPHCEGLGFEKVEMQFLSEIYVPCPVCEGKRFKPEVLAIRHRDKTVSDVLAMTITEALEFFTQQPKIVNGLSALDAVGLGYLSLGQPANTLSGGESQRLKLVRYLNQVANPSKKTKTQTSSKPPQGALLLLDEPTTGLHRDDIARLIDVLQSLVDSGNSIIVIEHQMDVLKCADWILELGPSAGKAGGKVVFAGTPEALADADTATSLHLRSALEIDKGRDVSPKRPPGGLLDVGVNEAAGVYGVAGDGRVGNPSLPRYDLKELPQGRDVSPKRPPGGLLDAGVNEAAGVYGVAGDGRVGNPSLPRYDLKELRLEGGATLEDGTALKNSVSENEIQIFGAREHNLKNLTVSIARNALTVITGVSGSGKSSLAFDILFAEGQRRFMESISSYARQFVEQMPRPDIDHIRGIPPTVAIEQRVTHGTRKSTVATITEVAQYLRLLYARIGIQHSPHNDAPVISQSLDALVKSLAQHLKTLPRGDIAHLCAPLIRGRKGHHQPLADWAREQGYTMLRCDGVLTPLDQFKKLDRYKEHDIEVVTETLETNSLPPAAHLRKALTDALKLGKGAALLVESSGNTRWLSTERTDPVTGEAYPELDPKHFSWNSPKGWCPRCQGFGHIEDKPVAEDGEIEADYFSTVLPCPECHGTRLNPLSRAVKLHFKQSRTCSLPELLALTPQALIAALETLRLDSRGTLIAQDILPQIRERLAFMDSVGLGYLTLDRATATLSGGEAQRIRLAAQLGSPLAGVLYILDEPSIGLHARDNARLLDTLDTLKQRGNSLVVVEHNAETMRRADQIIDLGPGAGIHGGHCIAQGTLEELLTHEDSLTGRYLREGMTHPQRGSYRPLPAPWKLRSKRTAEWIVLRAPTLRNLKGDDLHLPLNRLNVICGISGAGKSTLIRDLLRPALECAIQQKKAQLTGIAFSTPAHFKDLNGAEAIDKVIEVDQAPIGKTPRSTPATYIGAFDIIRTFFASLPEAKIQGCNAGSFSFNTTGGRCETCGGAGRIKVAMNFLPDSYVTCEDCNGTRYGAELNEIRWNGKNIAEVLEMSFEEAAEFFDFHQTLGAMLRLMSETGLGYLRLGQSSPTLSGGEAQRLKLVSELVKGLPTFQQRKQGRSSQNLYILEEPTIGLHLSDCEKLIGVLHRLVDDGHTVLVIEHHTDIIREADYLVELGPEGGNAGGRILYQGNLAGLANCKTSPTRPYVAQ